MTPHPFDSEMTAKAKTIKKHAAALLDAVEMHQTSRGPDAEVCAEFVRTVGRRVIREVGELLKEEPVRPESDRDRERQYAGTMLTTAAIAAGFTEVAWCRVDEDTVVLKGVDPWGAPWSGPFTVQEVLRRGAGLIPAIRAPWKSEEAPWKLPGRLVRTLAFRGHTARLTTASLAEIRASTDIHKTGLPAFLAPCVGKKVRRTFVMFPGSTVWVDVGPEGEECPWFRTLEAHIRALPPTTAFLKNGVAR